MRSFRIVPFQHPDVGEVRAVEVTAQDIGTKHTKVWFKVFWGDEVRSDWFFVWVPWSWCSARLHFDTDKPITLMRPALLIDHPFAELFLIKIPRLAESSTVGPEEEKDVD